MLKNTVINERARAKRRQKRREGKSEEKAKAKRRQKRREGKSEEKAKAKRNQKRRDVDSSHPETPPVGGLGRGEPVCCVALDRDIGWVAVWLDVINPINPSSGQTIKQEERTTQ